MATATADQEPLSDPSAESSEPAEVLAATPYSLTRAVHARRPEYVGRHRTRVKIGTWNVAACPGTDKDLARWFVEGQGVEDESETLNHPPRPDASSQQETGDMNGIGLYVLGLQEIVDLNLTKEYMTRAVYADNSATVKWQAALEAAMPTGYELVVAEQMFGLLLLVYASADIAPTISSVSTKQVGTGVGGWFANKGAVSTRLVLGETTSLVLVNCHLTSGATAANLDRRCFDAKQIMSRTEFDPIVQAGVEEDFGRAIDDADFAFWFGDLNFRLDGLPGDDIRRLLMLHARGEYGPGDSNLSHPEGDVAIVMQDASESGDDTTTTGSSLHSKKPSVDSVSLPDPDDFPEDPSQDPTSLQATLDSLIPHDQLKRVVKDRKVFHDGWKEGAITFLPTYKYDVGTVGLFDSSEKQRAPSWCDRVLYRTRKDKDEYEKKAREEEETKRKDDEMRSRGLEEDDDVLFTYDPEADSVFQQSKSTSDFEYTEYDEYDENEDPESEDLTVHGSSLDRISVDLYRSHQNITSSDHKPVVSMFTLDYDAVIPELKSRVYAEVARELDRVENEGRPGVTVITDDGKNSDETAIDFGDIQFLEKKNRNLTIANTGGVPAKLAFIAKPSRVDSDDDDASGREWLSVVFSSPEHSDGEGNVLSKVVTLEPGETVSARVTARVSSIPLVRALNDKTANIDDVLVLRVEDGRDYFIPVRGTWQPSCFGRSMDELIRIPDGGIRKFLTEKGIEGSIPYDMDQKMSAPQELFKITTAMEDMVERSIADETMLGDIVIPQATGWPLDASTWTLSQEEQEAHSAAVAVALDTAKPLLGSLPLELPALRKLEILSSVLVLFLSSLTDGIIPRTLWFKLNNSLPQNLTAVNDGRLLVLDVLSESPSHNISLVFLTTALARIAAELTPTMPVPQKRLSFRRGNATQLAEQDAAQRRRAKERRFAELVAPAVCRSGAGERDKASREKERAVLEVCLRLDDG
ncbi:inositol polyphosphate 5-phosphatase INPP5B/F [Geosmithia morbida]|uniref:Inositol polyphosphate 5-phosphatase INPP5B/F n=1 Tax=Geosmithia morbida TaxID=1094350 RepID=A0A9P4YUI2_9HYPO|nr:inositol polyphosphate 5-phosphatase INPP5B/F [Geosmithia morbida]KAF4121933.1 inositol polyphosphate 5-phosphatase INPP5B/F [Geosmithia morbida]